LKKVERRSLPEKGEEVTKNGEGTQQEKKRLRQKMKRSNGGETRKDEKKKGGGRRKKLRRDFATIGRLSGLKPHSAKALNLASAGAKKGYTSRKH